jgi:hypothetical protein
MARGSGLRNVLAALEKNGSRVKSHGGYYTAQCPAHDDRNASLSITQGEKGAMLTCHARCDKEDIIAALELKWVEVFDNGGQMGDQERQLAADLWMPCQNPPSRGGNDCPGHKAAEYRYTDENGALLYAVARCSRKADGCSHAFAQWIPDASGKFGKKWGLPGSVRRVLYNLPRVIAAAKAGRRIWIMEGEKDADRMRLDFPDEVATTVVSGAGKSKWRLEYSRYFKGASEVIIVADCDRTGLEFAEEVHRHLSSVTKTRVVCSPLMADGADFSDHRDHGFGLDDFEIVPFEPIKKRPRMVIEVEEEHREKKIVFSGFSQESVERSLVGAILRYGYTYDIAPIDIRTDPRLTVAAKAVSRLAAQGANVTPESVALEIEEMGISTYEKALPSLLEFEGVAFSEPEKAKIAARILRERTMRTHIASWLNAAKARVMSDRVDLGDVLNEMRLSLARHAQEYVDLAVYSEPVGDVFTGDVLEEIILEEQEEQTTNVRQLRPQPVPAAKQKTAQGG